MGDPSPTALNYTGPIITQADRNAAETHVVVISKISSLTTTGGGVIADVYSDDPSGYSDWSHFLAIYDAYRVLAGSFEFRPNDRYSKVAATVGSQPGAIVVDRTDVTALSSLQDAADMSSMKWIDIDDPFKIQFKMTGADEAGFISTASSTAKHWFKLYLSGLANSHTYGISCIRLRVQFRTRK